MIFEPTSLPGVVVIRLAPHRDARGFFARWFCPEEFAAAGLAFTPVQMNLSRNDRSLTLRGLHYQEPPHAEAKIVRCVRGRIRDVVVDIRRDSATFLRWQAFDLDAESGSGVFVPAGFAHGFLTFAPDTDILYLMDRAHQPGVARGIRWNDPAVGIEWPATPAMISEADRTWPDFRADG